MLSKLEIGVILQSINVDHRTTVKVLLETAEAVLSGELLPEHALEERSLIAIELIKKTNEELQSISDEIDDIIKDTEDDEEFNGDLLKLKHLN